MTTSFTELSRSQLEDVEQQLAREFELVAGNKMALNLSRGKPAADQVELSNGLEDCIAGNYLTASGIDCRNYGDIRGIPEARELGQELMGVPAANIIAGGNSSLTLMHLVTSIALQHGLWQDDRRWSNSEQPKILTPVPGYDRHFALTQSLGIDMVNINIDESGPDLAQAQDLVSRDPSIKGIWCVPKYSNPTGCTYSDDVVAAIAQLPKVAAADDFVVLWDNAYAAHDLSDQPHTLASIFDAAQSSGTSDHIVQFASTSKITFAGSGIAFLAASEKVLNALEERMSYMMIGPDKVNQLRHARFLRGRLRAHMQQHAELLWPKFASVEKVLAAELGGLNIATWTKPKGGYFVSLDLLPGLASLVVEMAKSVGLTLTPAGATYPYGQDPQNGNVRIAPSFATEEELHSAMQILTLCVKLASARLILNREH